MQAPDLFGHTRHANPSGGKLAQSFILPPFSVLNAREGWWQERKAAWLALGIESELGRGNHNLGMSHPETTSTIDFYAKKRELEALHGRELSKTEAVELISDNGQLKNDRAWNRQYARTFGQDLMRGEHVVGERKTQPGLTWVGGNRCWDSLDETSRKILAASSTGTSIFDPVICELTYRWFCPPGGHVLDPFAGGSVRGIVASVLGYRYTGVDLSTRQVEANRAQAAEICVEPHPCWHIADSRRLGELGASPADLIFSCPPYADLERYSDDPRDLSTMDYADFRAALAEIVAASAALLRPNRFACFVVGDIRDKRGYYRGLPRDTVGAFEAAGLRLYNDAVLVTSVGSLPVRTGKQFTASRKLGKTHQNVLVFVKGDGKLAAQACSSEPPQG